MPEGTYWNRRRFGRRTALRGAGVAVAGLAGGALLGCGGDDDEGGGAGATTVAESEGAGLEQDQIRIPPGAYEALEPTAAEQDPMRYGRRGGTLLTTYLDPPHMDFNRTCRAPSTRSMDYTKNKLTRATFGPYANRTA